MIILLNHGNRRYLCNQLFPLANIMVLGLETRQRVMFPSFIPYAGSFVGSASGASPSFSLERKGGGPAASQALRQNIWRLAWLMARLGKMCGVVRFRPWEIDRYLNLSAPETRNAVKAGARQVLRGFYCIHDEALTAYGDRVREYFKLVPPLAAEVDACTTQARLGADVLIGVHLRMGDYRDFLGGALFYEGTEYRKVMESAASLFSGSKVRFMICSNESQPPELFHGLDVCRGPGGAVTDLYALAGCDYVIGAPSTYSAWASFYGRTPRFVLPERTVEERQAGVVPAPRLSDFKVHEWGYGAYESPSTTAELRLQPFAPASTDTLS